MYSGKSRAQKENFEHVGAMWWHKLQSLSQKENKEWIWTFGLRLMSLHYQQRNILQLEAEEDQLNQCCWKQNVILLLSPCFYFTFHFVSYNVFCLCSFIGLLLNTSVCICCCMTLLVSPCHVLYDLSITYFALSIEFFFFFLSKRRGGMSRQTDRGCDWLLPQVSQPAGTVWRER